MPIAGMHTRTHSGEQGLETQTLNQMEKGRTLDKAPWSTLKAAGVVVLKWRTEPALQSEHSGHLARCVSGTSINDPLSVVFL